MKDRKISDLNDNVFDLIGKEWMLITAGEKDDFNTMTAAWGGLGVLWNKNVVFTFVRDGRYTYEYCEKYDKFTLTFFGKDCRDALKLLGTKSGRDGDKVKESGLTPEEIAGSIGFEEARLTIVCKKIYFQDLDNKNFLVEEIERCYPDKDYHRMYVGEIEKVYTR
jgi:flavin reductase (DIM6/NTAB) family NADH-FMN oxidoreductase RutF